MALIYTYERICRIHQHATELWRDSCRRCKRVSIPIPCLMRIGDYLPSLMLKNGQGEDVETSTLASDKGVILFLVPKADTRQHLVANMTATLMRACGLRDSYPDFASLGYDAYCLSADMPATESKWRTKKELPYPLLSDCKRTLIATLGADCGGKTDRGHFIFKQGGKLVQKRLFVKPAKSRKLALKYIKSLG